MARITLRDYNNEINDLIDHRQIDEAISHCRHVLTSYPKHVDTYRLLGKAYLEEQRYGDAADILQRVLSSIPDDFIAQIGMSIIREDEMNLDAAIDHMELAFESQPSNHAIQDELRRLFAKRDGMEPPRIRLTRGALARMYAHGHLYEQAISELQTALSEDPKRYDLQTLLAEMLYQADKKVEAAETCTRILEKLPYNLDANRLLAMILKESDRDEEAKRFQQRWEALDPYAAFVTEKITKTEQVPDNVVMMEREDWEPTFGDMPDTGQPAWASSLGVSMEEDETPEEIPDWLSPTEEDLPAPDPSPLLDSTEGDWMAADASSTESPFGAAEQQPTDDWMAEFTSETPQEPEPADVSDDWLADFATEEEKPEPSPKPTEEIPEFLKEAGWEERTSEEEPVSLFDQPDIPAEPNADEEIPDWMKEMAPSGETTDEPPPPDLGALGDIQAEADPDWEKAVKKGTGEPTPEWIAELGEQAEETPAEPGPSREVDPAGFLAGDFGEDDTDDWLASLGQDQAGEPEEEPALEEDKAAGFLAGDFGEDDTDDWLSSFSEGQPETPSEEPLAGEPLAQPSEAEEGADDWLASLGQEQAGEPEEEPALEEDKAAGFLAGDFGEDDTDDWLSSLSEGQPEIPTEEPAGASEPFAEPSEDEGATDDWLASFGQDLDAAPEEEPAEAVEPLSESSTDEGTDDWLASLGRQEEVPPSGEEEKEDTAMDWLTSLGEQEEQEKPAITGPAPGEPLATLTPKQEDTEETGEYPSFFGDEEPETPEVSPADEMAEMPKDEEAEGMAWLEGLAAKQGVAEEELVTSPEEREESLPDWLSQPIESEPEMEQPSAPEEATEEDSDFAALFGEPEIPSEEPAPAAEEAILEDEDDFSMDWLDTISQEAAAEAGAAEELPDFGEPAQPEEDLSALFGEPAQEPAAAPQEEPAQAEDEGALDWLQQFGDQAPAEEKAEAQPTEEEEDLSALFGTEEPSPETPQAPSESVLEDVDDFSMDWLDTISQEAAAEAGAAEELPDFGELAQEEEDLSALFGEPAQTEEDEGALDWLQQFGDQAPAEEKAEAQPSEEEEDLSALFGTEEPAAETPPAPSETVLEDVDDFSMDWLDTISQEAAAEAGAAEEVSEEPTAIEELLSTDEPEEQVEDLSALFGEEPSEEEAPEAPPEPTSEPASLEDEGLAWLESLAAKQGVAEEELVTTPEERTTYADDRTPDWLKELDDEQPEQFTETEAETPTVDDFDDLDAFLDEVEAVADEQAADKTETVLEDVDDFSMDWLESISQEAAAEAGAEAEEAVDEAMPEPSDAGEIPTPEVTDQDVDDLAALFGEEEEPPTPTPAPTAEVEEAVEEEPSLVDELSALEQEDVETPGIDTIPEWMKIVKGEEAPAPPGELEATPEDAAEVSEPAEAAPVQPDVLEEEDDFATGWLQSISEEAAAEAGAEIGEEAAAETPEPPPAAETPEWLTTIEEDADEELAVEDIPDMAAIFGGEEEESAAEAEPAPGPVQQEEPPTTAAEAPEAVPSEPEEKKTMVPEWLQEIADEKPSAEPVIEPEWLPEVEEPEPQPDVEPAAEADWQPEAEAQVPAEPEPVEEEPEAEAPPVPQPDEVTAAKRAVQSGDLQGAIKQFNAIIKKGKLVEEAIEEIKEALRKHPVNVELWQMLGDAYMKENNLQEALDAYSKAENLLR